MLRRRPTAPSSALSLALAGAGTISVIHGLAAAAAGLPVVAVASSSAERAAERAGQLGARVSPFAELPAGAGAVVVSTPPAERVGHALHALRAGAAVLVEKPMAATLAAADALVEAADAGGVVVYGENLAFSPLVSRAVAMAAELGPLRYIEVRTLSPAPDRGELPGPSWGGGTLLDLGVHAVGAVLLLAGDDEPVEALARLSSPPGQAVDDEAEVRIRFASGLEARIESSWRHPDALWDLQASSATGVVRADLLPVPALERDGQPVALPADEPGVEPHLWRLGYVEQLRALDRARAGGPATVGARFGRRALELVCAAYASAGSGAAVPLPFSGPRDRTPLELWRG